VKKYGFTHRPQWRASLESVASARTIFFVTFSVTRQEIIQFTYHASAKTVTLHTFFHSENHGFM